MDIQVFSDFHIELWNKIPEIPAKSKYLFLAGDICQLTHPLFFPFLEYCSKNWIKIFYVPGNHEFYIQNYTHNDLLLKYKNQIREKFNNIYFLDNEYISLDEENINIYGATFWTQPTFNTINEAKIYVKDYQFISYQDVDNKITELDFNYINHLSCTSFYKLQKYLNETDKKTIVMTHFPPTQIGTSNPKYLTRQLSHLTNYFAWPDNTVANLNTTNILAWISGHTHWSYDFIHQGVRLIGNQLGYKTEVLKTRLNEKGVYTIIS